MNFWVDMDGVLNKYIRDDYRGTNPVFMQKGRHYYKDTIPDIHAISMLSVLSKTNNSIFVLSKLPENDIIYFEHYYDKLLWLHKNCPFLKDYQFHTTSKLKSMYVIEDYYRDSSGGMLTREDILIDDYNDNLVEWEKAGGIGVKYINGVNSEKSWNGYVIRNGSIEDIRKLLLSLKVVVS